MSDLLGHFVLFCKLQKGGLRRLPMRTADNYTMCRKRDIIPTFPRKSRHFNQSILSPREFTYDERKDVLSAPPEMSCGGSLMIKETGAGTIERGEVPAVFVRLNPFAARIRNKEA
jgi:hypothetical protein